MSASHLDIRVFDSLADGCWGATEEEFRRLQAAAPELLAECRRLRAALEVCFMELGRHGANTISGPGRSAWETARAALGLEVA